VAALALEQAESNEGDILKTRDDLKTSLLLICKTNPKKRIYEAQVFLSSFHALTSDTMLELGKETKNILSLNFSVS
jgi:hypothetical protein